MLYIIRTRNLWRISLWVLFHMKRLSFPHIAKNIRTAPSKKNAHVTKNLHSMLIYFILTNAIAHCYKQTVMKSLTKQSSSRKKVIYLDFNLVDTKFMHKKWFYVWMLMLILIHADLVQSVATLVVSILPISSQIKWNYNDMNKECM